MSKTTENSEVCYTTKILASTCKAIHFISLQHVVHNYLTLALYSVVTCCFCRVWLLLVVYFLYC
jgi:hypothetical protein